MMNKLKSVLIGAALLVVGCLHSFGAAGCSLFAFPKVIIDTAGHHYDPNTFYVVHNGVTTYWDGDYGHPLTCQGGDYLWISYPSTLCALVFNPAKTVVTLQFTDKNGGIHFSDLTMPIGYTDANHAGGYETSWWMVEDCTNGTFGGNPAVLIQCQPPQ